MAAASAGRGRLLSAALGEEAGQLRGLRGGRHLIGPEATELRPRHPTLGEAAEKVAHGLAGHMVNL